MDRSLWEKSGHWETFREHMFTTETEDGRVYAVKPMNCPGCVQVFKQGNRSYRDLPLRIAEFGKVHRYEPSGALHGLMRVRAFAQDDAHIFCAPAQMESECRIVIGLIMDIYRDFGFEDVRIKFSDRAGQAYRLRRGLGPARGRAARRARRHGLRLRRQPRRGGVLRPQARVRAARCDRPRLAVRHAGRSDLNLPERLDASYIGEDGERHRPVMLHRALFGSFERFIGVLLEHYAGRFPLWLAPLQLVVATITSDADDYAAEVAQAARKAGLRVELDLRNEKIGYKVREHSVAKVPVMLVVGRNEVAGRQVAIRRLGAKDQEVLALDSAIDRLSLEAASPLEKQDT